MAGMPGREAAAAVLTALERSAVFQMAARPRQPTPILFNRHDVGMAYGPHVDEPVTWAPAKAPFLRAQRRFSRKNRHFSCFNGRRPRRRFL